MRQSNFILICRFITLRYGEIMTSLTLTGAGILISIAAPIFSFFILTKIPSLNKLVSNEPAGKYIYLDPVRGIAALLVFIHHSMMVYNQHAMGKFDFFGIFNYESLTVKKIYFHFGQTSVMAFFMITGFLFFSKILASDRPLNANKFFSSRIKRLFPAMLSVFVLYVIVCYLLRDESYHPNLLEYFTSWLTFGLIPLPNIASNIPGWSLTAGVFWTLIIEWKFYIIIPLLSALITSKKSAIIFLLSSISIIFYLYSISFFSTKAYINEKDACVYLCFMVGLLIAIVNKFSKPAHFLWVKSPLAALAFILFYLFAFYKTYDSYNFSVTFTIGLIMFAVISGNSFFGLLKLKVLHWAGKSSYSIYLMHALVMQLVFHFTVGYVGYYASLFIAANALCFLTLTNYLFVERKYMHSSSSSLPSNTSSVQ